MGIDFGIKACNRAGLQVSLNQTFYDGEYGWTAYLQDMASKDVAAASCAVTMEDALAKAMGFLMEKGWVSCKNEAKVSG